jgi:hypothetical protein
MPYAGRISFKSAVCRRLCYRSVSLSEFDTASSPVYSAAIKNLSLNSRNEY